MPLTDGYGQNIPYPTLSDKPNIQTMGQGIVEGIVPKSVMTFASAIVRGATISAPKLKAGMATWLQDVKRLEVYDGSAWVTVAAGTSVWTNVPLDSSWTNNGNSNGNFQYRVVNLFGEITIMFQGAISRATYPGTLPGYFQLNTTALPSSARPASLRTVVVPCSDAGSARITLKLDITTDGWLRLYGVQSDSKPAWVGFNGVFCSL